MRSTRPSSSTTPSSHAFGTTPSTGTFSPAAWSLWSLSVPA